MSFLDQVPKSPKDHSSFLDSVVQKAHGAIDAIEKPLNDAFGTDPKEVKEQNGHAKEQNGHHTNGHSNGDVVHDNHQDVHPEVNGDHEAVLIEQPAQQVEAVVPGGDHPEVPATQEPNFAESSETSEKTPTVFASIQDALEDAREAVTEAVSEAVHVVQDHLPFSDEAQKDAQGQEVVDSAVHEEPIVPQIVEENQSAPVAEEASVPADVEEPIVAQKVAEVEAVPESAPEDKGVDVSEVTPTVVEVTADAAEVVATNGTSEETFEKVEAVPQEAASEEETFEKIDAVPQEAIPEQTSASQQQQPTDEMAFETNYPVPYRSKLLEPFEPGQTLIVKGKTGEDSVRFTVNLHNNAADFSGNDVPLHISVRFDEGKIVFNTFSKGEWGKEERKSNPYKKGDDIDIRIRAHDSKFQIFVDQKELKEYEHRVPLSSITHFSIDGDVLVSHIHWGGKYYPVPYESGLAGEGLAPGKSLILYGIPEKKGKRFHINLLKKNGDIALHFNVRFDEKAVVRNSLIANAWGNEEREGKLPFEKATGFDLEIKNEEYAFAIIVDGERFASYAHRLEPHELNGLQIGGDVEVTGIQIA